MADEDAKPKPTWGFEGDDRETVVARAIYGVGVDRVRQHAAALDLQHDRLRRVFETARGESDRSAAILMFALAEDLMLDAVKRYLNPDIKGGWDELVGGNGLLATANDRITLLYLLRWIQPIVYADLRLLKSIRNRFAHHADVASFEDKQIRSWIGALAPMEKPAVAVMTESGPPNSTDFSARQLFLMRSAMTVTQLVSNLAVAPAARANQVAPGHVEGDNWEDHLENLKELKRIAAVMVITVANGSEISIRTEGK